MRTAIAMGGDLRLILGAVAFAGAGLASHSVDAASGQMQVSAQVVADCELTADDLNFGAYVVGNGPREGQTTITYDCAPNLQISIGISDSALPSGAGFRQMWNSTQSNILKYDLYKDTGHSMLWGEDGDALVVPATASGSESVTVYGLIEGGQASIPEDVYTDTLQVTLTIDG